MATDMGYGMSGIYAGWLAFIMAFIVIFIIIAIAIYVYMALVLSTVAKKLKHKSPWLAWIPIANGALLLELGDFHWAWIFLILIPILGWIALGILMLISTWRVFEKRKYPGWLSLIYLVSFIPIIGGLAGIAMLIIWGLVAWSDR